MYITDFMYAGIKASDLGLIIANITSTNSDTVSMGSKISFDTVQNQSTYVFSKVNAKYETPISVTFEMMKTPCQDSDKIPMTDEEISYYMRWLNRKGYYDFKPIYDDGSFFDVHYHGTFTEISLVQIDGITYGFNMTFETNSPFGYQDEITNTYTFVGGVSQDFYDVSDEYGKLFPRVLTITYKGTTGNTFSFVNDVGGTTEIANMTKGEVITMDCEHKIISSSLSSHTTLCSDFNYVFPYFSKSYTTNKNVLQANANCVIEFKYEPVRKVGIIV